MAEEIWDPAPFQDQLDKIRRLALIDDKTNIKAHLKKLDDGNWELTTDAS